MRKESTIYSEYKLISLLMLQVTSVLSMGNNTMNVEQKEKNQQ